MEYKENCKIVNGTDVVSCKRCRFMALLVRGNPLRYSDVLWRLFEFIWNTEAHLTIGHLCGVWHRDGHSLGQYAKTDAGRDALHTVGGGCHRKRHSILCLSAIIEAQ